MNLHETSSWHLFRQALGTVFLLCCFQAVLFGQSASSTITGRLTAPDGAVIAGANIRVVNANSGVSLSGRSNEVGLYRISPLQPGNYRVEVGVAGFQRLVRADITVQVSQVVELDLELQVGNLSETVNVTGAAPVVEAQSSSVGQLVDRNMIEGMPLPNRAATALVVLSPGAAVISQGSGGENIPIFSVAGGRVRNQNYSLDGGNVTNVVGLAVPQQQTSLPMDAMQEFRIISNNYAAEHGHSTGGIVTLSTRAGGNQYHGSVFEYFRNDKLDARNFFAATRPRLRYNQFGGSFGGPIIKDKTHFFASWEETRQVTGGTVTQTLPTALQRDGDFSETRDAQGRLIVIYDPLTTVNNVRQPFPGNKIPANRIDPVAKAVTSYWPLPNRAGTITGANNFNANSRPQFTRDIIVGRFDHQFRASDQLMVRYYINNNSSDNPGVYERPDADPSAGENRGRTQSILGAYTHLFGSRTVNEFRYGYVRRLADQSAIRELLGKNYASQLGLKGVSDVTFPTFTIAGVATLGREAFRRSTPLEDSQIQNAITHNRGKHSFKAGVEYRWGFFQDDTDISSSGNMSFTQLTTGQPGNAATGVGFASFLLGEVNGASINRPDVIRSHAAYWAWYVQDDWRLSDRLTINLGLRWEAEVPRTVDDDRMNSFDPVAINPVSGTPGVITFAGRNGVPRSSYDGDYNNFGPRVGFAYRLPGLGTTVIRGGGGIFYGPTVSGIIATAATLGFSTNGAFTSTQPGITSAFRLRDGFPAVTRIPPDQLGPGFGAVRVGQATTTAVGYFERERPTPISFQYNLNVQHELWKGWLLEVGYLANLSHHLTANTDLTINQVPPALMGAGAAQSRRPFPQFSGVSLINPPIGNSTYHAGFVKAEKRFAKGFSLLAHYTFSKFIDDVTSFNELGDPGSYMDVYNRHLDKGLSGSDIPHRVVISGVYALPFFKTGVLSAVLGGWKTGVIANFQSGAPFTVFNNANTTNAFSPGLRPDLVGDPRLPEDQRTLARYFNTDAFRAPAQFRFGTSPRSVLRGPGFSNVDFSLLKEFRIRDPWRAEFRGEFFNLLNHANFGLPGHSLGGANFGVISGAGAARVVQLALRVVF